MLRSFQLGSVLFGLVLTHPPPPYLYVGCQGAQQRRLRGFAAGLGQCAHDAAGQLHVLGAGLDAPAWGAGVEELQG